MLKRIIIVIVVLSLLSVIVHLAGFGPAIGYSNKNSSTYPVPIYELKPFRLPATMSFANEPVPLKFVDVKEALDRELYSVAYWHSNTFTIIKRASRFFPLIEPILKKYNIPDDMKYLAVTETGLLNEVSPAGAKGFWQFMDATGKEFGLIINDDVDERYHVEKSTVAACKYLNRLYAKYNNWALVCAAFNMGQGALDEQMKFQMENNYYDLLLNRETGRYVYRTIAFKMIFEDPQQYGFVLNSDDLYPIFETSTVNIDSSVANLAHFAHSLNISYKMLKYFNPWLISRKLDNKNKTVFQIVVPKDNERIKNHLMQRVYDNTDTVKRYTPIYN